MLPIIEYDAVSSVGPGEDDQLRPEVTSRHQPDPAALASQDTALTLNTSIELLTLKDVSASGPSAASPMSSR